jgi:tetratricopeptide (TPR) repeat protein
MSTANALKQAQQFRAQGRAAEAAQIYMSILSADPGQSEALFHLGVMHHQRGDLKEAGTLLTRATMKAPHDVRALFALATIKLEEGLAEDALALAARAIAAEKSARVLTRAGGIYAEAGQMDKARESYEAALLLDPASAEAWQGLSGVRKFTAHDPAFAQLAAHAEKSAALPAPQRIRLEFALGKAHFDAGLADKAFAHYATANKLQRAEFPHYDIAKFEKYIDSVITLFDAALVEKLRGKGTVKNDRPVFIVGMPRSGSTLADQILSSHPEAASIGESRTLQRCIPAFENKEVPRYCPPHVPSITGQLVRGLTPERLDGIAQRYLQVTEPLAHGATRLVDKMLFNYTWVGIILLALPHAKIIHCTRDPMDMGLSIWQTFFQQPLPWAYDQAETGRYYRAYEKLMAHWENLFPGVILEMKYEDMVAAQEAQTRRLLDFCGLPFDERCLKFHENTRQVKTASIAQVRQPIYKDSAGKWKKYAPHLATLSAAVNGA